MIKDGLRARGMPEDLVYLAAIESGYSPGATSRVSASGMWQFMGPTAQEFGLRIDEYVDERRDPDSGDGRGFGLPPIPVRAVRVLVPGCGGLQCRPGTGIPCFECPFWR